VSSGIKIVRLKRRLETICKSRARTLAVSILQVHCPCPKKMTESLMPPVEDVLPISEPNSEADSEAISEAADRNDIAEDVDAEAGSEENPDSEGEVEAEAEAEGEADSEAEIDPEDQTATNAEVDPQVNAQVEIGAGDDVETDALTEEEQERARAMFDSMGMDGDYVSVAETRAMLAAESKEDQRIN
jgi:hypothetical protein